MLLAWQSGLTCSGIFGPYRSREVDLVAAKGKGDIDMYFVVGEKSAPRAADA